jgi:tRNA (mo5U34)-methyltransferase
MYELATPGYDMPERVEALREAIAAQPFWFHHFTFANGVTTPGHDPSAAKLHALQLPDLTGLTVIDIGAFDGYFSFQAEARGAARVVASDWYAWHLPEHCALENFRLVKRVLGSSVEEQHVPVPSLDPELHGTYDVALFLGVLYHAPNMVEYLERVRSVTKRLAVVETLVDMLDVDEPCAAYYPAGLLGGDQSNWWGPNLACVEDMLRRVGFSEARFVGLFLKNQRDALHGMPTDGRLKSGRAVFHAFV